MKSKKHFDPLLLLIPIYAVCFIVLGFGVVALQPTKSAPEVTVATEEIEAEPVSDLDLDLNTKCSQASQFGLTQLSTVYFEDETAVVLTEKFTQIDNEIGRGHVVSLSPMGWVEGWFDINNEAVYAAFGNGKDITSDWFVTTLGEHDDVLTQYLSSNVDYSKIIDIIHSKVNVFENLTHSKIITKNGVWYKSEITNDVELSSINVIPSKTVMQVFIPNSNDLVTQVDVILYYDKNDMGATHEVYEYEVVFTDDYYCEVPAVVTEAIGDYDDQLTLYHEMMR